MCRGGRWNGPRRCVTVGSPRMTNSPTNTAPCAARRRWESSNPERRGCSARDGCGSKCFRSRIGSSFGHENPETEALRHFRGTPVFPPDRRWVVESRWHPYHEARSIHIESAAEPLARDVLAIGEVEFELAGKPQRLVATEGVGDPDSFTLRFRDATSGIATYGPVRELVVRNPGPRGLSRSTSTAHRTRTAPTPISPSARCRRPAISSMSRLRRENGHRMNARPVAA